MKENLQGATLSILAHAFVISLMIVVSFSAREMKATVIEMDFSLARTASIASPNIAKGAGGNKTRVAQAAKAPQRNIEPEARTMRENERIEPASAPAVVAEAVQAKRETEPSSSVVLAAAFDSPKENSAGGAPESRADPSGGRPQKSPEAVHEKGSAKSADGMAEGGGTTVLEEGEDYNFIRSAVMKNLPYPRMAKKRRIEGSLLLSFRVLENGTIADVKVKESSGHPVLDDNAVAWVAGRVIPRKMPYSVKVDLPINYVLRDSEELGT
jgi:protein TonB